jgi:hypothetical protein
MPAQEEPQEQATQEEPTRTVLHSSVKILGYMILFTTICVIAVTVPLAFPRKQQEVKTIHPILTFECHDPFTDLILPPRSVQQENPFISLGLKGTEPFVDKWFNFGLKQSFIYTSVVRLQLTGKFGIGDITYLLSSFPHLEYLGIDAEETCHLLKDSLWYPRNINGKKLRPAGFVQLKRLSISNVQEDCPILFHFISLSLETSNFGIFNTFELRNCSVSSQSEGFVAFIIQTSRIHCFFGVTLCPDCSNFSNSTGCKYTQNVE